MKTARAKPARLEHIAEAGAATIMVAGQSSIAETPATNEPKVPAAEKRGARPRAKTTKPRTAAKPKAVRGTRKVARATAAPVEVTALASEDATTAITPKRKRKSRAKTPVTSTISEDATNLANLVDSLRGRVAPTGDAAPDDLLPAAAIELFDRCARDYQRESDKLVHRRRRIGALVYPATPEQITAISDWFVRALNLRLVDIDARSLVGLTGTELADRLAPLTEPTARIVTVRGLGLETDPRVSGAIASADVDVLVIAFADPGAKIRMATQQRLRYRIDLLQAFPLDVAPVCFNGTRHERLYGGPSAAVAATPPLETFSPIRRLVTFFRSRMRTAGW